MVKSEQNAFQRKIDWANRRARSVITIGGYSIIVSIVGILLFLIFQSLPLTFKTSIKNLLTVELPAGLN
jgi:ABC-type phosphate transport system permease subunit